MSERAGDILNKIDKVDLMRYIDKNIDDIFFDINRFIRFDDIRNEPMMYEFLAKNAYIFKPSFRLINRIETYRNFDPDIKTILLHIFNCKYTNEDIAKVAVKIQLQDKDGSICDPIVFDIYEYETNIIFAYLHAVYGDFSKTKEARLTVRKMNKTNSLNISFQRLTTDINICDIDKKIKKVLYFLRILKEAYLYNQDQ